MSTATYPHPLTRSYALASVAGYAWADGGIGPDSLHFDVRPLTRQAAHFRDCADRLAVKVTTRPVRWAERLTAAPLTVRNPLATLDPWPLLARILECEGSKDGKIVDCAPGHEYQIAEVCGLLLRCGFANTDVRAVQWPGGGGSVRLASVSAVERLRASVPVIAWGRVPTVADLRL
jgi:hypothetical protein